MAVICEAVNADIKDVALGHGLRPAHRLRLPAPRPGLRRFVLPEGHRRAPRHRGAGRLRLQPPARRDRGQRAPARARRRQGARGAWAASSPAPTSRVWGLTFKANTDDLRDSPALAIARRLAEEGADGPRVRPGRRRDGARQLRPSSHRRRGRVRRVRRRRRARRAHRVGRVPLARLRTRRRGRWRPRASSTRATSSTPSRCAGSASTTRASVADAPRRSSPGERASSDRTCAGRCSRRGDDVVAVDNFVTGRHENVADLVEDRRGSRWSSTTSCEPLPVER